MADRGVGASSRPACLIATAVAFPTFYTLVVFVFASFAPVFVLPTFRRFFRLFFVHEAPYCQHENAKELQFPRG